MQSQQKYTHSNKYAMSQPYSYYAYLENFCGVYYIKCLFFLVLRCKRSKGELRIVSEHLNGKILTYADSALYVPTAAKYPLPQRWQILQKKKN